MLRAVRIRLYPNATQATQINKLLGCCRVVYNTCLARKMKSYKENKISENLATLGKFFHNELLKDDNFVWLREQNTKVLKQAIIDMLMHIKISSNDIQVIQNSNQRKIINNLVGLNLEQYPEKIFILTINCRLQILRM